MTEDEKRVLKEMGKVISGLVFSAAVYEAVVKKHILNWPELVQAATASPALQELKKILSDRQESIESSIDESNLSALLSKIPKTGRVN